MNDIDAYNQAIADTEAALADLKAKRAEAMKVPAEPHRWGAVIRQTDKVPAFRRSGGRWAYVTISDKEYSWEELMKAGGTNFKQLY